MRKDKRASVLTTLVFTDIVSSTAIAEEMGDRRWQELLSRHYQIIRRTLREHDGKERDTAGDGVFSSFDSPASGSAGHARPSILFASSASGSVSGSTSAKPRFCRGS